MRVAWKLTLAYARHHPARMLLTSLAMVASACVVVWVVSGYDALTSQFGNRASEYLGRFDLFVVPDAPDQSFIPADLVAALREDPAVAECESVLQWTVRVQPDKPLEPALAKSPGGGPRGGPGRSLRGGPPGMMLGGPKLVGTHSATSPYELLEGDWLDHSDPARRETVISNQTAAQLQVALGDELLVILGTKEYRLKIIGIVAQTTAPPTIQKQSPSGRPQMAGPGNTLGPAASALYVPMPLAEKITRQTGQVNLVSIRLRDSGGVAEFSARWLPRVAQVQPAVLLVGVDDIKRAMEEGLLAANTRRQAWAATGMSLLAALFIIFTTLSMGVHERVRQFALMRAVGLTRRQVAQVIAAESVVLALIGWGGGLAAGWGMLAIARRARPELFDAGAALGGWCVLLTGASALGGALLAALLPAWQATRVLPLDALAPRRPVRPHIAGAIVAGVIGCALVVVNPLLVYALPIDDAVRYGIYVAVGCTSMAIGFLLLTPLAVRAAEAVCGPCLAWFLWLDPRLLRSQLSSNMWRSVGATVALAVGLGLYVSMMVWGYSMLEPFRPGRWVPDMLAAFQLGGLPDAEVEAVRQVAGVVSAQCLPLAVEQPRLAGDITGSEMGNSVTRQDNVILIGLDPQVAFGGPHPLVNATFVDGSREEAVARLRQGRHCLVPDHFLAATGLRVGDRFAVLPPAHPGQPVEYTIAGAVSLPGWHWMTKFSGLRRRSGRSAAIVFALYEDVRRDFDIRQVNFLWMNIDPRVGVDRIGTAMQEIADRNAGQAQPVNAQGTWGFGAKMFGRSLRITTPEEVETRILARADGMIWAMCQLPLITLLVTSLAVVNTILASVRARRWELGVLRAIGVTRWAVARMVLAEGLLIGLVACVLSLSFGVMAGWCGTGISQYVSFFGGLATPLIVPWSKLLLGFSITLALCLAAALCPAYFAGRAEPLTLLQEGRAAM